MRKKHVGPLRIFVDTSANDYWHRIQFEEAINSIREIRANEAVLVESPDESDCILRIEGGPSIKVAARSMMRWPKKKTPPELVWDMSDLPSGLHPGLYVSLPAYMYDNRRHKAFCLPYTCNEMIRAFDPDEAQYLYGYCGSTSSGLRGRLNPILIDAHNKGEAIIEIRDPIWNQMFDRSGLEAKEIYANTLRCCKFSLCPRGCVLAGAGSRLYETMQAARVPVIISDWITLPEGIDWESCTVRIKERDIKKIPQILAEYSSDWRKMAKNAHRIHEKHFSKQVLLGELGRQLKPLVDNYYTEGYLTRLAGKFRIAIGLCVIGSIEAAILYKRAIKAL
jgi:hypothetical protein